MTKVPESNKQQSSLETEWLCATKYYDVILTSTKTLCEYLPTVASICRKDSNSFVITAGDELLPRWRIVNIKNWNHKVISMNSAHAKLSIYYDTPVLLANSIYTLCPVTSEVKQIILTQKNLNRMKHIFNQNKYHLHCESKKGPLYFCP